MFVLNNRFFVNKMDIFIFNTFFLIYKIIFFWKIVYEFWLHVKEGWDAGQEERLSFPFIEAFLYYFNIFLTAKR